LDLIVTTRDRDALEYAFDWETFIVNVGRGKITEGTSRSLRRSVGAAVTAVCKDEPFL
jgi:hypothetical protein